MEKTGHYAVRATIDGPAYDTRIAVRGHELHGDEPVDEGGADTGPKAHEYLCTALASCTAITLRMYADRKQFSVRSIHVDCTLDRSVKNAAVDSRFNMKITINGELTSDQRQRMLQIAEMCPVHKTLNGAITLDTQLAE